jgi:hypothetical protein
MLDAFTSGPFHYLGYIWVWVAHQAKTWLTAVIYLKTQSPTVHKEEHMWGRRVEFCYQSMLMVRVEPKQHALNDEKKIFADEPNSRWHWCAKPAE